MSSCPSSRIGHGSGGERRGIASRLCLLFLLLRFAAAVGAASPAEVPPVGEAAASARDELFRRVFKRPPPPMPIDSYVMVSIDGGARHKMRAVLAPGGHRVLLDGKAVAGLLSGMLRAETVQQLERAVDAAGLLDTAAIERAGMATGFDPRTFEVSVGVPPGLRATRTLYLSPPLPDPLAAEAIRPASVSGFLNLNLKGSDRSSRVEGSMRSARELGVALDGAVNVRGLILEGSAFGQAGHSGALDRGDLRLVYDLPQRPLRFMAGDLTQSLIGYQAQLPVGGIGVARDFSLQPQLLPYWSGEFSFELQRPAEVRIFMNDSLLSTLQLPAGVHDLRRFTPAVGQNDIDVVIDDSAGRREILHFSFIHDPALLDRGLSTYSLVAGLERRISAGEYHYDPDRPTLSGAYLRGVTAATTLGVYAQAVRDRTLAGVRALHALRIGTLQLDGGVSRAGAAQWDAAAKIALTTRAAWKRPQAGLSVEYLGRYFNAGAESPHSLREAWHFQSSLAVPVKYGLTARLSANYFSARRAQDHDAYGAAATLYGRWGRHFTGSLSVRHNWAPDAVAGTQVLLGLSASLAHSSGSYYLAKELEGDRAIAHWSSPLRSNQSAPYGFAAVRTRPGADEYQAGLGYRGNQGFAEIGHRREEVGSTTGRSAYDESTLRVQSALVFADGALALARTVRENFAIVAGKEGLEGIGMKVDPDSRGGSRASSHWLGPAVLTDLASYRLRDVSVRPVNAPLGATPERMTFRLAPTYKSGMLLRIGKQPRIVAIGRLVDSTGAPLAYLPIRIRPADRPGSADIETFTGRNGNFQAPDLTPGRYEIRPGDARWGSVIVEVAQALDGVERLGDIVPPPGPWAMGSN